MENDILNCGWKESAMGDFICYKVPNRAEKRYQIHKWDLYLYSDYIGNYIGIWKFKALRGYNNEGYHNRCFEGTFKGADELKTIMRQVGMSEWLINPPTNE